MCDYEKERAANIERNKALLDGLGLGGKDKQLFESKAKPKKKVVKSSRKRKLEDLDHGFPKKAPRFEVAPAEMETRRSQRNIGKVVDYNAENLGGLPVAVSLRASRKKSGPTGRESGKRTQDPKVYGSIPGIKVGTWWPTRQGCSADAVHAPWVAGISAGPQGAYSVALSGGYDDDVDLGYALQVIFILDTHHLELKCGPLSFVELARTPDQLRTAPQSSDQTFENHFNKALKKSAETRKPVRVIRGYKAMSSFAPKEGYRYDGLYVVQKAWIEQGLNPGGYLVCKFAFLSLPEQGPLPVRSDDEEDGSDDNDADADAEDASPADADSNGDVDEES
ncbi:hypothetical protein SERLA73DRAFT_69325 [Serpula lacrymans var. lacrymans S7.3]|uniref:YDG domain-containing protein n=2 Tax=Serpula lacrymans var. lacrymans TaxID=341189 RepID=F8PJP8_SERL3|nr:uncharacterized protein SERLADRAFT_433216 [Serpula lacrymans var. lacrymans S7.9]EGO03458.1 hypothetical protein SERLA73DRAFT_69325 [Serpula lacrymans var. lacrymans S7.3]EGO29217.1 hypothetical protein SERLADRAFT_433216 [Serpula lacrymans var. lacrymans S7.9]